MRKLLVSGVAAVATLAIAGGAVAQVSTPNGDATFDATFSPAKVGTAEKPSRHTLRTILTANRPGTTVGVIQLKLTKGLKFTGKGMKRCTVTILEEQGPAGCPSGSRVGPQGTAGARLEAAGTPGADLDLVVDPFVQDNDTFLFNVQSSGISIHSVLKGEITNRGRTMRITIPLELRQPVPGVDATLTHIDATFSGKLGKRAGVVLGTGCKNRRHLISGTLEFANRADGGVAGPSQTLTDRVSCRK